jgi:3-hydroxyisobutyrate dehydrogenase-like beta-hydroxyacid dehydrogenase
MTVHNIGSIGIGIGIGNMGWPMATQVVQAAGHEVA